MNIQIYPEGHFAILRRCLVMLNSCCAPRDRLVFYTLYSQHSFFCSPLGTMMIIALSENTSMASVIKKLIVLDALKMSEEYLT